MHLLYRSIKSRTLNSASPKLVNKFCGFSNDKIFVALSMNRKPKLEPFSVLIDLDSLPLFWFPRPLSWEMPTFTLYWLDSLVWYELHTLYLDLKPLRWFIFQLNVMTG